MGLGEWGWWALWGGDEAGAEGGLVCGAMGERGDAEVLGFLGLHPVDRCFFTRGPWWTAHQGSVDRVNLRVDRGGP